MKRKKTEQEQWIRKQYERAIANIQKEGYRPATAICNSYRSEVEALSAISKSDKRNGTYKVIKVEHPIWGETYEPWIK